MTAPLPVLPDVQAKDDSALLDVRHLVEAGTEERGRRHDQQRGVNKECAVERDHGVDQVEAQAGANAGRGAKDAARLNQRGVQVEVVRHDRRAENARCEI